MKDPISKNREQLAEIKAEISAGELLDKITILEIKSGKIGSTKQLENIHYELARLVNVREAIIRESTELTELYVTLKEVNSRLWIIEDDIRDCEKMGQFDIQFIQLARSVYQQNDIRAALKKEINRLLKSRISEEKSYSSY